MAVTTKTCTKCGSAHPATVKYFIADKRKKDGLQSWCRECRNRASKEWYRHNKEKVKAYNKKYRADNPKIVSAAKKEWNAGNKDRIRARKKAWRIKNPEKAKASCKKRQYARRYGITLDDYDKMFSEQGGVCKICGEAETARSSANDVVRRLSVDHNHETGDVRALLCHNCNAMIGHARESDEILCRALIYLKEYGRCEKS